MSDSASIGSSIELGMQLVGSKFSSGTKRSGSPTNSIGSLKRLPSTFSVTSESSKYGVKSTNMSNIPTDIHIRPDLVTVDAPLSVMKYIKHSGSPAQKKLPNIKFSNDLIYDPEKEKEYVNSMRATVDTSVKKIFPYEIDDPHEDKLKDKLKFETSKSLQSLRQFKLGTNETQKREKLEEKIVYENFPQARVERDLHSTGGSRDSSRPNTTTATTTPLVPYRSSSPQSLSRGGLLEHDSMNHSLVSALGTGSLIDHKFDFAQSVYAKRKKIPTFLRSNPQNIEKMKESIYQMNQPNQPHSIYDGLKDPVVKELSKPKVLPGVLNPNHNNHSNSNTLNRSNSSPHKLTHSNSMNSMSSTDSTSPGADGDRGNTPLYTPATFRRPKHFAGSRDNEPLTLIGVDPQPHANSRKTINPTNQMSADLPLPLASYVFPPSNNNSLINGGNSLAFSDDASRSSTHSNIPLHATLSMVSKIPKTPQTPGGNNRKKFGENADLLVRTSQSRGSHTTAPMDLVLQASALPTKFGQLSTHSHHHQEEPMLQGEKVPAGVMFCQQCLNKQAVLWCTQCIQAFCGICWNRVAHHTLYNMIPIEAMNNKSALMTAAASSPQLNGGNSIHSMQSSPGRSAYEMLPNSSGGQTLTGTSITSDIQYPMYKIKSKYELELEYEAKLKNNPYYHSQIYFPDGKNELPKNLAVVADHVRYPRSPSRNMSRGGGVGGSGSAENSFSPPRSRSYSPDSHELAPGIPPLTPNKSYGNTIHFGTYIPDDPAAGYHSDGSEDSPLRKKKTMNFDDEHLMTKPATIPRDGSIVLEYQDYPNPPVFIDGKGNIHDVLILQEEKRSGKTTPPHFPEMNYHATNSITHPSVSSSTILPGTGGGHLIDYTHIRYKDPIFQSQVGNTIHYQSILKPTTPSKAVNAELANKDSTSPGSKQKNAISMESKIVIRADPYSKKPHSKPKTAFAIGEGGVSIAFSAKPSANYRPLHGISHEIIPVDWKQGYLMTDNLQQQESGARSRSVSPSSPKRDITAAKAAVAGTTGTTGTVAGTAVGTAATSATVIPSPGKEKPTKLDHQSSVSSISSHTSATLNMSKASTTHNHHHQHSATPQVAYSQLYTRHMTIPKIMKEREIHIFHGVPVYTQGFSPEKEEKIL